MTIISRDEVLHIARISRVAIHEEEIDEMIKQLEQVLSYAERVVQVESLAVELPIKNVNIFREDLVVAQNPEPIRAQAPDREENYFVIPVVLDNEG